MKQAGLLSLRWFSLPVFTFLPKCFPNCTFHPTVALSSWMEFHPLVAFSFYWIPPTRRVIIQMEFHPPVALSSNWNSTRPSRYLTTAFTGDNNNNIKSFTIRTHQFQSRRWQAGKISPPSNPSRWTGTWKRKQRAAHPRWKGGGANRGLGQVSRSTRASDTRCSIQPNRCIFSSNLLLLWKCTRIKMR